jgi:hypothetical protein
MMPRVYLKYDGGVSHVHRLVGLAPDNQIPTLSGFDQIVDLFPGARQLIGFGCPACSQQLDQSFFDQLNAGTAVYTGVLYTVIASTHDEVVSPYAHAFLPPGPNVANETVQSVCPSDQVGHEGLAYDPDAVQMIVNALDPAGARPVPCSSGFGL